VLLHSGAVHNGLAEAMQQRIPARRVARQPLCLRVRRSTVSKGCTYTFINPSRQCSTPRHASTSGPSNSRKGQHIPACQTAIWGEDSVRSV